MDKLFFSSVTEGASHYVDCLFAGYLDPEADNPLTPLSSPTKLQESSLDISLNMSPNDRCSVCHRYKKNAPNPDLNHAGSKGESKCKLDHFPSPCDFVDDDGNPCAYVESETNEDETDVNTQVQNKLAAQAVEMSTLKSDLADIKRILMANRTPPSSGASLAVTTTSTPSCQTSTVTTQSILTPLTSLGTSAAAGGASTAAGFGLLSDAANNLLLQNEDTQPKNSNLGDYGGPSMKDLQKDQSIAEEVQKQMNLLISGNPSLQKVVAGVIAPKPHGRNAQTLLSPSIGPDTAHPAYQAIHDGHSGHLAGHGDGATAAHRGQPPNLLDMDLLAWNDGKREAVPST